MSVLPAGVGFVATETEFNSELEAIREVDPRRSRTWKIKNPHSRNIITGALPLMKSLSVVHASLLYQLSILAPSFKAQRFLLKMSLQ